MTLAWLRNHARNCHRGSTKSHKRLALQQAYCQYAGNKTYVPRVTYDNSFIVDSSVTHRNAVWVSDEQYKSQYFRLGWEVAPIRKDGNCLFRSLSDQLYGHERRHLELRRRLVDFIDQERTFFEPFINGEGVVEYCSRLRETGALGGYSELVAASRLLGINIVVHTGPVKRLHIDATKYARTKEGKGKTINLLLRHDYYSSLRKLEASFIYRQHGCSDTCLCKRIATSSKPLLNSRASLSARSSDRGSNFRDHSSSNVDTRSSLGAQPVAIGLEKHRRAPIVKGAYGRKHVPDADASLAEDRSVRKKLHKVQVKPKSRPPPPPERSNPSALELPCHSMPVKPKTKAPAAPSRPKVPASVPPTESKSNVHAAISKPTTLAPSAKVLSTTSQLLAPVQHEATSSLTMTSMATAAVRTKSPGVVLFHPESLKPMMQRAPLAILFDPGQAPPSRPILSPVSKEATTSASTSVKPTPAKVLEVGEEAPGMIVGNHSKAHQNDVHRPRRAVFNGGKRRPSSTAASTLLQEVLESLNTTASKAMMTKVKPGVTTVKHTVHSEPVVTAIEAAIAIKPSPSASGFVEIKKSSKKVFHQGRPVAAR